MCRELEVVFAYLQPLVGPLARRKQQPQRLCPLTTTFGEPFLTELEDRARGRLPACGERSGNDAGKLGIGQCAGHTNQPATGRTPHSSTLHQRRADG